MAKDKVLKATRTLIKETVEDFDKFVCGTMGPGGLNMAIETEEGAAVITKDGVSVANVYEADTPSANLIARVIKEAAQKTNTEAGDGTTTSTAITSAVVRVGNQLLDRGYDGTTIRREFTKHAHKVLKHLKSQRVLFSDKQIDEVEEILYKVALISTNGDTEISRLIAKGTALAGEYGLVTAKKGGLEHELEQTPGMKLENSGVVKYDFIQGCAGKKMTMKNCYILLTTYEMESASIIRDLEQNVINEITAKNGSLLIIPKKADKAFLANMINFNATGTIKNAIVRAPYFGGVGREVMDDIAAATGATVIDQKTDHKFALVTLEHLGFAKEVEVDPHHTVLYSPKADEERVQAKIEELQTKLDELGGKPDSDKTIERLAALNGSLYTIKIPSTSAVEDKEQMDRIEDALNACKGALKEGYVAGGGVALLQSIKEIGEGKKRAWYAPLGGPYGLLEIEDGFAKVLSYPFERILENAEIEPGKIRKNLGEDKAYDVRNNVYGDPLEIGVIDSYKVVTSGLKNGTSVGLMLLTTAGIIADKPAENATPYEWDM